MASDALRIWRTARRESLDEVEAAHAAVGGIGPGRRTATQQLNRAYVLALSSQFQGFCRDLHGEAAEALLSHLSAAGVAGEVVDVARLSFAEGRKLARGNPNAGNIGSDFAGLGLPKVWDRVRALDKRNVARQKHLAIFMSWRNAVAHDDFSKPSELGDITTLRLSHVRAWRAACDGLATSLDEAVVSGLSGLLPQRPW